MGNINAKYFTLVLLFTIPYVGIGQILDPVDWEFSPVNAKLVEIQEIQLRIILDDSWYIYSNDQDPDVGPKPTEVIFEPHDSYQLVGEVQPLKVKEKYDEVWMGNVRYIDESGGGFVQKIKILKENPVIKGTIVYSVCSTETGLCIFPEEEFEIKVLNP